MTPCRPLLPALCAGALLASCSILPEATPVDRYLLPAAPLAARQATPLAVSLRVARPATAPRLAGARIAVIPQDNVFSTYQGARWSDPAPLLLRDRLLDAFRADGRIAMPSSDAQGVHADLELGGELLAFQSEYRDGKPHAVIRLDAQLVQVASRRIVASRRFEAVQPAAGKEVDAVVRAFGQAGDALAARVVDWTAEQAAAAQSPR